MNNMNRRELLRNLGLGALAIGVGVTVKDGNELIVSPASAADLNENKKRKRLIRIAHLTDMHIEPERHAAEGVTKALHHVNSQKDKPELILFGGDHVMDSMAASDTRTTLQWKLWHETLKNENSIPHESTIGNHDVWGWTKSKAHTTGDESNFGKKRAIEELGLSERYRSLDKAGWHFIFLDSIYPKGAGYKGLLDDEQFAWLENDLKANAQSPTLIVSHIPLFSMTPFVDNKLGDDESYRISSGSVHGDWGKFRDLFKANQNVKVALSGHTHLIDRVDYNKVSYLCNGAVSGSWWKGPNGEGDCPEGYAIIDLYDDGSFEHEYVAYGWTAEV
jgi:3',5'-cyclic AMP phosphodiesterase CpdA